MNGSPTFHERQVRYGRKVCEAKELIRKVAAPGSAGMSLVKPFEPRRPGGQVERERPTADDYFRRERRQRMMVRRCQAAHNRDYRRVRTSSCSAGTCLVAAAVNQQGSDVTEGEGRHDREERLLVELARLGPSLHASVPNYLP